MSVVGNLTKNIFGLMNVQVADRADAQYSGVPHIAPYVEFSSRRVGESWGFGVARRRWRACISGCREFKGVADLLLWHPVGSALMISTLIRQRG